jgi:hypothetical protein
MILKRTPTFNVLLVEEYSILQVYCVDLFCESFDTLGLPSFVFEERYYETETKQRVIRDPKGRDKIWIVVTEQQNLYVREI